MSPESMPELSEAVRAYAESHGLTIDEAVARIARGAELMAAEVPKQLQVTELEGKLLDAISRLAGRPEGWTTQDLMAELGIRSRQQVHEYLYRLVAAGALTPAQRMVPVPTFALSPGVTWVARANRVRRVA